MKWKKFGKGKKDLLEIPSELKTEEENTDEKTENKEEETKNKKGNLWLFGLMIILSVIMVGLLITALIIIWKNTEGITKLLSVSAFSVIVVIIGLISRESFGVIRPNQKGIKVTLGIPAKKETKGWYFALWPVQKMIKITKELMLFKFTVPSAITRRGKVDGQEKVVESAEVDIKCAIYAQFDEDHLSPIIQYAPGYNAKSLGPFLIPYAIDTVRAMAGRLPWRLINRERFKSATWVQARLIGGKYFGINDDNHNESIKFKEPPQDSKIGESIITRDEIKGKSPFAILRMKNVSFVIEDLIFSDDMRKSITAAERANLDAEAKIIAAVAEKTKRAEEGQGDADARGSMLEKIKSTPELETLSTLKEIGKGPSNFIFALPDVVQKVLAKIGGLEEKK